MMPNGRPKTEAEQLAFFRSTYERFIKAGHAVGIADQDFQVAGETVRLRFAGSSLMSRLSAALQHLRVAQVARPDLTLCLWDSASSGVEMPPPPCPRDSLTDRGDIWGFGSGRIKTAFHYSDYSVNVLDHETGCGVYWVRDASALPYWVDASPLRTLFHWWMERRGLQLMHAAAVGTAEGAVLITGKGGAGKSSTALSALDAGLSYLADDYLVVRHSPEPRVYSLYATAKLGHGDVRRFPEMSSLVRSTGAAENEKAVMFLHPERAGQIVRELPIRAMLVPNVADREDTTFTAVDPATVRQAATFTTMSQLPYVGRQTHEFFVQLCDRVSGYRINLGRDRSRIAPAIAGLLADPPAATRPSSGVREAGPAPLVSVVIPVYNGATFLREAVENVVAQRYPSVEIIVVDDGSTDETAQIVEKLPYDVRYFRQDNLGPSAARNRGIRDTTGDLIAFLDVDDLWPEQTLRRLVEEAHADPTVDVVRGYAQLVEQGEPRGGLELRGDPKQSFPDYIGAALYRKRVFGTVGLFDVDLIFGEDSDWFNRAREAGVAMKRLELVTLYVRRHGGNMTEGKSVLELNMLRVFKKAIDRRRNRPGKEASWTSESVGG